MSAIFRRWDHFFPAYPIGSNHRHEIGSRMSLHAASPMRHTVTFKNRFGANRRRIKQYLCSHKSHTSGRFRKPLIPAYANPYLAVMGIKYFESGIPRCKIKLFLIIVIIRNMCLPIHPQQCAVRINAGNGII